MKSVIIMTRVVFLSLRNYQYVRVVGYQRIFAHPAAIFFERGEWPGIAKPLTKEIASLSTRPDPARGFVACAYQIPRSEWEPLAVREEEFAFVEASTPEPHFKNHS